MRSIRLQRARRIRFIGGAIGSAALVIFVAFAASVPDAVAATPATINPGQIPTSSAGYPNDCGQGPGWVFVLPAAQGDAFVSISATFQTAGVVAGTVYAGNTKFAYVNVPLTDTLLTASAMIDGGHEGSTFNLTHVCNQGVATTTTTTTVPSTTSTSTSTTTSTSTSTTTTTEAPTTTTTVAPTTTSTVVVQTTSTTEAPTTTTTEAPTTTTTEAPTTTSTVVAQTTLPPTTTTIPTTTSTAVLGSTTSVPETTTTTVPVTTITGQGSTITTATTVPVIPNDTPTTQANSSGSGALPFTGSGSGPLALFALAALVAGVILASRRRAAVR